MKIIKTYHIVLAPLSWIDRATLIYRLGRLGYRDVGGDNPTEKLGLFLYEKRKANRIFFVVVTSFSSKDG